ncbi:MAG TPA: hypothetical protein VFB96_07405 [Pirellulaceae bacterium]|jgi:hypothetical protein|nr:hypothetical protein [Pirellulaceae bacterium]
MCTRKTADPLVRTFLDKYGLNLLSIPRKEVQCGDLYVAQGSRVSTPGSMMYLLEPKPTLPAVVTDEALADLKGIISGSVSTEIGLGLMENLLTAFGASAIVQSLKAGYKSKRVSSIRFQFKNATRDHVDPLALGSAIKECQLDGSHPFVVPGNTYFLVAGVVRTRSISVIASDEQENAIEWDAGALQVADVAGSLAVEKTAQGELTYTGKSKLAIGVELYELRYDEQRHRFSLTTPENPPRIVRGSKRRAPLAPALLGGSEGDIFISPT